MDPVIVIGFIFAYAVFIAFTFIMRASLKAQNPKYSFLDDILLFTGAPVVLGYLLIIVMNPNNLGKLAREVVFTPTMIILLFWMVVGGIIMITRNVRNRKY